MYKYLLVPVALFAFTTFALAEDDKNLTGKAKTDLPGANSSAGSTAQPNARPDSGSLPDKQQDNQPGAASAGASTGTSGSSDPNVKPNDNSLSDKQKQQQPNAKEPKSGSN